MSFSWGYIWRKWRATLQVEPVFLETAGGLIHDAALPTASQPDALVEDSGATIEQASISSAGSPYSPGFTGPTLPNRMRH